MHSPVFIIALVGCAIACVLVSAAGADVRLVREPVEDGMMEVTPLVYRGRLLLMECHRPASGGERKDFYLTVTDVASGKRLARFAEGYSLACAIVFRGEFFVYASRHENEDWNDVTVFRSRDLKTWKSSIAIRQQPDEHLFNSSVCAAKGRFVMAYETNDPRWPAFTIKFAESTDLVHWRTIPDAVFGKDRYTACPCIRWVNGAFQLLYLEHMTPEWRFETYLYRSRDLLHWETAPRNPILAAEGADEGINASDPDIVEFRDKTYLYYATGDQRTWANLKRAVFPGSLSAFFRWCFTEPVGALTPRYAPPEALWKQTVVQSTYPTWLPPLTPAQERFKDLKFGIFIHWGIYSVLGHGEWALFREHREIGEYDRMVERFRAEDYDPETWVRLAERAGARYMNVTTKHHDGFCLFDSRLTGHTAAKEGPKRDLIRALSDVCHRRSMPLFFYYSLLDWHFPGFAPGSPAYTRYMHGQVQELATRYGPAAGFWFDMGALRGRYRGEATWDMIRKRQPNALIMPYDFFVSERSLTEVGVYDPEGRLMMMPIPAPRPDAWPLEVCDTMNGSWGYNPSDTKYRSAEELIREFVTVVGKGGNLLLNISPTPSGEIPPEQVSRLHAIGDFLKRSGVAIYGTRPAALPPQPWGFAVTAGERLFLHVLDAPSGELTVAGLTGPVSRVATLDGREVPYEKSAEGLLVRVPAALRDPVDTVLEAAR